MLGISKLRTGLRFLEDAEIVEFEDVDEMADENERCREDDDATALYVVVPEPAIFTSRGANDDEYVRVVFDGLEGSKVTNSNGILRGFAVSGS